MRRQLLAVLVLAIVPVILAFERAERPAELAVVQVSVNAQCDGPDNTAITLRPWNVRIRQGDQVEWVLNPNANSDEITITPKRDAWPFIQMRSYSASKDRPARTQRMLPGARGRYAYNVTLICRSGDTADTVLVDPDIIID